MFRNILKRLIQVFLVALELGGCSFLVTYLSNFIQSTTTMWEFIERMVFSYGIYQIIVYIILSNCNDIRKDSYLALLSNYKRIQLYYSVSDMGLKKKILENIEYQLDKRTLNDRDICAEYKIMKKLIEEKNEIEVEYKIIVFEHLVEEVTLNWKYSFLLRLLK